MESWKQEFRSEGCGRPQHLGVDQWYVGQATRIGVELWSKASEHEIHELRQRKLRRRLEKWRRKPADPTYSDHPSNQKLAEAKSRQFTAKGKHERVDKSLAALRQTPNIRLTGNEWRQIVADPDLEDQLP